MAKVDGFNVSFTHRGSWKADLLEPGRDAEQIPVTWKDDWDRKDNTIFVWLKKASEIEHYLSQAEGFLVAVGVKNHDGSTSAENIAGIFLVKPLAPEREDRIGLKCSVERRVKAGQRQ